MANSSFTTTDERVRKSLRTWFEKLPQASSSTQDIIVTLLPWFVLIIGVIKAFSIISLLSPFLFGTNTILYLGTFIAGILLLMAFFKLTRRNYLGWKYTYWAILLNILLSVIAISFGGVIIGLAILYVLFQVERRYKAS